MDYGYLFGNTPGNRKNIKEVGDDIQMVSQVTYLFIHVKGLAEQIDYVPVLALVLKVTLYMFREGLKIAVIPNQAHFIHQDKGIGRELNLAEICYIKQVTAWDFPVRVYLPSTLTVTEGKLCHKGSLAGAFLSKNHIKLVRVAVLPGHPEHEAKDGQEGINQNNHETASRKKMNRNSKTMQINSKTMQIISKRAGQEMRIFSRNKLKSGNHIKPQKASKNRITSAIGYTDRRTRNKKPIQPPTRNRPT